MTSVVALLGMSTIGIVILSHHPNEEYNKKVSVKEIIIRFVLIWLQCADVASTDASLGNGMYGMMYYVKLFIVDINKTS